jgi:hypothetical protein
MVDHVNSEPKFELIGSDGLFSGLRYLRYGTGQDDPTPFTLTLTPQYVAREVKKKPPNISGYKACLGSRKFGMNLRRGIACRFAWLAFDAFTVAK